MGTFGSRPLGRAKIVRRGADRIVIFPRGFRINASQVEISERDHEIVIRKLKSERVRKKIRKQ